MDHNTLDCLRPLDAIVGTLLRIGAGMSKQRETLFHKAGHTGDTNFIGTAANKPKS